MSKLNSRWLRPVLGSFVLLLTLGAPVFAQQTYFLLPPKVGSGNVADADPPVIRPTTTPCRVQLFSRLKSGGSTQSFAYAPPANCPAPWSKVVFVGDFNATGTNQFDRTAEVQLGDTMIYYGTTQEPSPTEQPTWHVESDLTDYTALFKKEQVGSFLLQNYIEGPYCCSQYASAYLQFYPANAANPAPRTADKVLPLPEVVGAQSLNTTTDSISQVFNLPENTEQAYLDVFTQGQSNDEFWWSCIPNDALSILGAEYNCGNTAFRQAEITVDGKLAGFAPIYPYVFTGGVDPDFWRPIPGVQTLNFKPYRIDLTPFAGVLSNGTPHTVAVSVFNADSYFLADATLLVFQDPDAKKVTGELTERTIYTTAEPKEVENLATYASTGNGSITVTQDQSYRLKGYVNTSHGKVDTEVESNLTFVNAQTYTALSEVVQQKTTANRKSTTTDGGAVTAVIDNIVFPFSYSFSESINSDGSGSETLGITQKLTEYNAKTLNGDLVYESTAIDQVAPVDTLDFDSSGNLTAEPVDTNTETYTYVDTLGHCWDRTVSASNALVSAESDGKSCPQGKNQWH